MRTKRSRGIRLSGNDVRYPRVGRCHGSCMRCPEEVLDAIGKQASGADAQPVVSPDEVAIGCNITCSDDCEGHKFSTNKCESQGNPT
jgi:hypothetical protein